MRRVLLLILVAVSVGFYLHRNAFVAARYIDASPSDFSHYYDAARALSSDQSPYTVHNFDYPPLVALVVRPLASTDYAAARWLWFLAGHAALLAAAVVTWLALGRSPGALAAVAATWGLCGTAAENLVLGQIAPLILFLVAVALLTDPALPLGIAAALKIFPGVLLAREFLARRWVTLGVAAATIALLVALPLRVVAPLPGPALPASSGYWMGTPALLNVSIPAHAWRAFDRPEGETLPQNWISGDNPASLTKDRAGQFASVVVSIFVLLAGATTIALRRGDAPDRILESGAWMTLAIFASPIAWYHYALLLFPFFAAAALHLARARNHALLAMLVVTASVLTWGHRFATGRYIETYGWTAKEPLLLYAASVLPALAGLALFALLTGLMAPRASATTKA